MMYWDGNGMSSWGYALMFVGTAVFWTLVLAASVVFFRHHRSERGMFTARTPEQELAGRFARGDITHAVFVHDQEPLRAAQTR